MEFPRSPWRLRGDLLLSLWRTDRTVVATAFVDYQPGGDLTYHELLRARPVRSSSAVPAVRITDIWVDSAPSRDGGRALWAIPKDLAGFTGAADAWSATLADRPIAAARFRRRLRLPGRCPLRLRISQPRGAGVPDSSARGTAVAHVASADWVFARDGPLGDLDGRRPLLSLVLADFRITFG